MAAHSRAQPLHLCQRDCSVFRAGADAPSSVPFSANTHPHLPFRVRALDRITATLRHAPRCGRSRAFVTAKGPPRLVPPLSRAFLTVFEVEWRKEPSSFTLSARPLDLSGTTASWCMAVASQAASTIFYCVVHMPSGRGGSVRMVIKRKSRAQSTRWVCFNQLG